METPFPDPALTHVCCHFREYRLIPQSLFQGLVSAPSARDAPGARWKAGRGDDALSLEGFRDGEPAIDRARSANKCVSTPSDGGGVIRDPIVARGCHFD